MSKISEQKALEAYPIAYYRNGGGIDDANAFDRAVYEEGYDQALQDFMERACEWLKEYTDDYIVRDTDDCWLREDDFIEQFKNYMQNEM